jgi:hypothetical protein
MNIDDVAPGKTIGVDVALHLDRIAAPATIDTDPRLVEVRDTVPPPRATPR